MFVNPEGVLAGAYFLDWANKLPLGQTKKTMLEIKENDGRWQELLPLPIVSAQDAAIATLSWHNCSNSNCEVAQFSCACWLYLHPHQKYTTPDATVLAADLLGSFGEHKFGGFYVGLRDGKFGFWLNGNSLDPDQNTVQDEGILDSKWHHCVTVYNSIDKTPTLYIDGVSNRTDEYLAARPVRLAPRLTAGGIGTLKVPMASYAERVA